uniref:Chalcone-flavonone isomerase family protein n=1 Tax=Kalanchoe fedtschenkoi TaxID=63787 RepID=A0A7N0TIF3_KALFE
MAGVSGVSSVSSTGQVWASSYPHTRYENPSWAVFFTRKSPASAALTRPQTSFLVLPNKARSKTHLSPKASPSPAVRSEYTEEPGTSVKFQTSVTLPGCSRPLLLLGTGYREKVFAIIGVKVYAAGLYINSSALGSLSGWSGRSSADIQKDSTLFKSIYEDPSEKSLQIVLVRDVDGKTFWDALNDAISPRIKAPSSADESALTTFRATFEGRPLKKGTFIFLTWLEPSKMLVSISPEGLPSAVDATIESESVTAALFDVFLGDGPVSPTLKASVSDGLASMLK